MSILYSISPVNKWRLYLEGPKRDFSTKRYTKAPSKFIASEKLWREPKYVLDMTGGKFYKNEYKYVIRYKGFCLATAGFLYHSTFTLVVIVAKTMKLLSLYPFIESFLIKRTFEVISPLKEIAKDFALIVTLPIYLIGMELSAIHTIIMPYDGRKLYHFFEKKIYGEAKLAPCFEGRDEPVGDSGDLDQINFINKSRFNPLITTLLCENY